MGWTGNVSNAARIVRLAEDFEVLEANYCKNNCAGNGANGSETRRGQERFVQPRQTRPHKGLLRHSARAVMRIEGEAGVVQLGARRNHLAEDDCVGSHRMKQTDKEFRTSHYGMEYLHFCWIRLFPILYKGFKLL